MTIKAAFDIVVGGVADVIDATIEAGSFMCAFN